MDGQQWGIPSLEAGHACIQVLLGWLASLAPGGLLAVAYWPPADGQQDAAWRALTDPALFKNPEALPL